MYKNHNHKEELDVFRAYIFDLENGQEKAHCTGWLLVLLIPDACPRGTLFLVEETSTDPFEVVICAFDPFTEDIAAGFCKI